MDLRLTEEQQMLRKTARVFLEKECPKSLVRELARDETGHSRELWHKMAELGWTGLVFPQQYGGSGGSFLDLIVLLEEMGRACLPGPFFSSVVLGGLTVLDAGSEAQKQTLLRGVAAGDMVLALALTEPSSIYDAGAIATRAIREGNGHLITGTKLFVSDAHVADYLVCAARTSDGVGQEQEITLFLVDSRSGGVVRTPISTLGLDRQCQVVFDKVEATEESVLGKLGCGWGPIARTLEKAAAARCADMVGSARAALEMSVSYAKERVQFGRPIGSFQAIQHYCANMAVDVDASSLVTYEAAWRLSQGLPSTMAVSIAKSLVNEACQRVTLLGHQIHGGIGFCEDHDMHLFHRRVRAGSLGLGGTSFHQRIVATELLSNSSFFDSWFS